MKEKLRVFSLAFMLVLAPLARFVRAQPQANDARKTARVKSDVSKRVASRNTRDSNSLELTHRHLSRELYPGVGWQGP